MCRRQGESDGRDKVDILNGGYFIRRLELGMWSSKAVHHSQPTLERQSCCLLWRVHLMPLQSGFGFPRLHTNHCSKRRLRIFLFQSGTNSIPKAQ